MYLFSFFLFFLVSFSPASRRLLSFAAIFFLGRPSHELSILDRLTFLFLFLCYDTQLKRKKEKRGDSHKIGENFALPKKQTHPPYRHTHSPPCRACNYVLKTIPLRPVCAVQHENTNCIEYRVGHRLRSRGQGGQRVVGTHRRSNVQNYCIIIVI